MKAADRDSDMDDQDRYNAEMDLLKKHAEQRIAVMQGEKIKIDDEMEEVKINNTQNLPYLVSSYFLVRTF